MSQSPTSPEEAPLSTKENPLACPVPDPDGKGLRCTKPIPVGWRAEEGHGGGHCWMGERMGEIIAGGHFDAMSALSMQPFEGHTPQECPDPSTCRLFRVTRGY